jgi:predicted SAM-dependent methyltransferase
MTRLHIGAGASPIAGWTNVDIVSYPGVDAVLDVRQGLPFTNVELIFAEHFLEHLPLRDGLRFLSECRRVLRDDGVLRLSTPNLEWVWLTHYRKPDELTEDEQLIGCLEINRAFHGWGHRFLYNPKTLRSALVASGFAEVIACGYRESSVAGLRDLERHELHEGVPGAPSVLIVEATGRSSDGGDFTGVITPYLRDFEAE